MPHKRRLSHEERSTPLSHLKHLLMPSTRSASDRPASPPVPVALASMAAARDGFARRGGIHTLFFFQNRYKYSIQSVYCLSTENGASS